MLSRPSGGQKIVVEPGPSTKIAVRAWSELENRCRGHPEVKESLSSPAQARKSLSEPGLSLKIVVEAIQRSKNHCQSPAQAQKSLARPSALHVSLIHSLSFVSCLVAGNHSGRLAKYRGQSQMRLVNSILIFKGLFKQAEPKNHSIYRREEVH